MPFLGFSRSSSHERTSMIDSTMRQISVTMDGTVRFIPAMMDMSNGTTLSSQRHSAMSMLWTDTKLITSNMMRCIPSMFHSLYSMDLGRSMMGNMEMMDIMDVCLQVCLGMMQMAMLVMMPLVCMMLPGLMMIPVIMACVAICMALCWPMNGKTVMRCECCPGRTGEDLMAEERWFHINGSMTSARHMQQHLNRVSQIFSRPITGIHNRTYGPIVDMMLPTIISRFSINPSSETLQTQLRDAMLSPSCQKVIIMAHGTGAAMLSQVMDRMLCDMPMDMMAKMEIYTFGSAARHMSNPAMRMERLMDMNRLMGRDASKPPGMTMMNRMEECERVIPHMEHYAFTTDLTASCGIMHHTINILDNRFCGRTFLVSRPGFMFCQYMDMLFPIMSSNKRAGMYSGGILDSVPMVDVDMAEKREFTAMGMGMGGSLSGMKRMSLGRMPSNYEEMMNGATGKDMAGGKEKMVNGAEKGKDGKDMKKERKMTSQMDGVAMAKMAAKECEGRTVKELSRLCHYVNGRRPAGDGERLALGMMGRV